MLPQNEGTALISPPALDAVLNGTSAILVTVGYVMIRTKRILAHKACMLAATATSAVFLVSYVVYHYHLYASGQGPVHFPGTGAPRYAYLTMLTTHTILAIVIVPLVILSLVARSALQFSGAQAHRSLDAPAVGLRLRHWRAHLCRALPDLHAAPVARALHESASLELGWFEWRRL